MQIQLSARGFQVIHFEDLADAPCSLQQSSLAIFETPGTSAIWLGRDEMRMHLSLDQADTLARHLQAWIDNGTFDLDEIDPE